MRRLDELAMEAARELQLEKQSDIFLWRERLEYRYALLEMWRAMMARVQDPSPEDPNPFPLQAAEEGPGLQPLGSGALG
jgi:hypothetical protein